MQCILSQSESTDVRAGDESRYGLLFLRESLRADGRSIG